MKHVSLSAKRTLDLLTRDLLRLGDAGRAENNPSFMAVEVERVMESQAGPIFSIAHYYQQNGDLMRDPEMEFLLGADGQYYPLSFWQDAPTIRQEAVDWSNGSIAGIRSKMQSQLAAFANTWLRNIRQQQNMTAGFHLTRYTDSGILTERKDDSNEPLHQ